MIIKHELKAYIKTFVIWTLTIGIMDFCFMLMYPSLQKSMTEAMDAYANMGVLTTAFGMDRLSMATPLGFYGIEVGSILSLGGSLFAAIIGTGVLSKEEGGHTAEFLYTLPYNRVNIILQKVLALFLIILAFDVINIIFGLLSFPLINAEFEMKKILVYHLSQFLMHFEIAAICFLFSAFNKKVSFGIGLGVTMLLYFLDMMSRVLEQLKFAKYITPYYYANAADVMNHGTIEQPLLWIGLSITFGCLLSGMFYYNRRDLSS